MRIKKKKNFEGKKINEKEARKDEWKNKNEERTTTLRQMVRVGKTEKSGRVVRDPTLGAKKTKTNEERRKQEVTEL